MRQTVSVLRGADEAGGRTLYKTKDKEQGRDRYEIHIWLAGATWFPPSRVRRPWVGLASGTGWLEVLRFRWGRASPRTRKSSKPQLADLDPGPKRLHLRPWKLFQLNLETQGLLLFHSQLRKLRQRGLNTGQGQKKVVKPRFKFLTCCQRAHPLSLSCMHPWSWCQDRKVHGAWPGAWQGVARAGREILKSLECFINARMCTHTQTHSVSIHLNWENWKCYSKNIWEKNISLFPFSPLNISYQFISSESFGGWVILIIAEFATLHTKSKLPYWLPLWQLL